MVSWSWQKQSIFLDEIKCINVTAKEKYFVFPWLGETKYMVDDIKANEKAVEQESGFPGRN